MQLPALLAVLTVPVILCLPTFGQAQVGRHGPLAPDGKDSLVQAYHRAKQLIRDRKRINEYRDNWDRPIRYNILKVDVPNWLFGEPNLGFERKVSRHATLMLHAAYFSKSYSQHDSTLQQSLPLYVIRAGFYPAQGALPGYNTRSRTIKLVPEIRGYLGRNAARGFFIGGYYYFNRIDWKASADFTDTAEVQQTGRGSSKLTLHGPGVVWGVQSIILSRISLGLEMGAAFMIGRKSIWVPMSPMPPGKNTPFLVGAKLQTRFNVQLGYCFGR